MSFKNAWARKAIIWWLTHYTSYKTNYSQSVIEPILDG